MRPYILILMICSYITMIGMDSIRCKAYNLYQSIWEDNLTEIKRILETTPSVAKTPPHNGTTPLYRAARDGKNTIVNLLLKKGANINQHNEHNGETPLGGTTCTGQIGTAHKLLIHNADVNTINIYNAHPLYTATHCSLRPDIKHNFLHLLLQYNSNPNQKCLHNMRYQHAGHTPLAIAACAQDMPNIRLLLAYGADPQAMGMYPQGEETLNVIFPLIQNNNTEALMQYIRNIDDAKMFSCISIAHGKYDVARYIMQRYRTIHSSTLFHALTLRALRNSNDSKLDAFVAENANPETQQEMLYNTIEEVSQHSVSLPVFKHIVATLPHHITHNLPPDKESIIHTLKEHEDFCHFTHALRSPKAVTEGVQARHDTQLCDIDVTVSQER